MEWSETVDISKFDVSAAPYGGPIGKIQVLWISKKYVGLCITCHPLPPFSLFIRAPDKGSICWNILEFWKYVLTYKMGVKICINFMNDEYALRSNLHASVCVKYCSVNNGILFFRKQNCINWFENQGIDTLVLNIYLKLCFIIPCLFFIRDCIMCIFKWYFRFLSAILI